MFDFFDYSFLVAAGDNPFAAMWYIFIHGGWLPILILTVWCAFIYWHDEIQQVRFMSKKEWMLLAIKVPRNHEQTTRAVENIFAHLAGAHSPNSWTEEWIIGRIQDHFSMEIVSIEGRVEFIVRCTRNFRDLVEASIYAQYPDAEINEVEDYTLKVPSKYPDPDWDIFGTEMIIVKPEDAYPLRTYTEFEDRISGEMKDPLAVLLENMSRLGPGEQAWYQIVILPIDQKKFRARGEELVKKLTGRETVPKQTLMQQVLFFPLSVMNVFLEVLVKPAEVKKADSPFTKVFNMTPGEKHVVEAVENKISKIAYMCKVRFLLVSRKPLKKSRFVHPFIGAIKQFNTNDMQALKPESKKVGMNGTLWIMKQSRNNHRRIRLMKMLRQRSFWSGTPLYALNIEELASLWHFPHSFQVKAPQLSKTDAKRGEPPINLPYG